jgi:hypothetical protein
VAVGHFHLPADLNPDQWRELTEPERTQIFSNLQFQI